MREYLEFAETGILKERGKPGGEPDSDFEISVLNILKKNGIKATPHIGVAGFRIDIGISHPHIENEFILGVECDGATYHSSKTARDRDRLREEILLKKGWSLHRIWSTDWFKNRDQEEERLLKAVNKLISKIELVPVEQVELVQPVDITPDPKIVEHEERINVQLDIDHDLRKCLIDFRREEIGVKLDEPSDEGILREEVLDFFVINKPTNMDEFHKRIPMRFREDTKPEHLVLYLAKIFDIVKEYTELSQV